MPVLGDNFGAGAAFTFLGGNRFRITLGAIPVLQAAGTYVPGTHAPGSASGINMFDTSSLVISLHGKVAVPLAVALDIDSAAVAMGSGGGTGTGTGSGSKAGSGQSVCIVARNIDEPGILSSLRRFRDVALESWIGRLLALFYYQM